MSVRQPEPPAGLFRRFVAAGSAALVLALTVFASSSELHDRLHAAGETEHEDGCAIVLFASGVALPLDTVAAPPPPGGWYPQPASTITEIFLPTPRYLRQPERGPPASRVG